MQLASHRTQLVIDVLAAHRLLEARNRWVVVRPRPGQEVRARDHRAVVGQLQVRLVQPQHVPPQPLMLVHRPLGSGVVAPTGVWERVAGVKVGVVPREQRHDEDVLADGCWGHVHTDVIACGEDGVQFGDGVGIQGHLGGVYPELVVAHHVEDAPEFGLEDGQAADDVGHCGGHVPCDNQHIVLELDVIDEVRPVLVVTHVQVQV
mmetsp:Transcript_39230/g.121621  ORF Transcript_39230/g.121621 Transcript_39230/m.121621 type:complete len:205 (-) Transcript_39230:236-850(-)